MVGVDEVMGGVKKRIAVILTHPAPYREPVVKRMLADERFDIDVISVFRRDYGHADMKLGEDDAALAAEVKTLQPGFFDGLKVSCRLIRRFVLSCKYDFVVWPAYAPWWLTFPILMRLLLCKDYAISLDTICESGGCFSRMVKRLIFRWASFLWVPGNASVEYLARHYAVSKKKIIKGLYLPVFSVKRMAENASDSPVFLMVANNIPLRRMNVVAEGFKKFCSEGGRGRLVLCGKGASVLSGGVVKAIEGVPSAELPKLYSKADVYVHNGSEQFSTALLMGAMSGKPLLVGKAVGVCADLFEDDNECGIGIQVEEWQSVDVWARAFDQMSKKESKWSEMGAKSKLQADVFDSKVIAEQILEKFL